MTKTKSNQPSEDVKPSPAGKPRLRLLRSACRLLLLIGLTILLVFAGCAAYLYYHPEHAKPLITQALSSYTDAQVTIEELTYSLAPMTIRAQGIAMASLDGMVGPLLRISHMEAHLGLVGPFGRRHLMINNLDVHNFSFALNSAKDLSGLERKETTPGIFARTLSRIVAVLLFRDIQLVQGNIDQGNAFIQSDQYAVRFENMFGTWAQNQRIEIGFSVHGESHDKELFLSTPNANISIEPTISLEDLRIKGRIEVATGSVRLSTFQTGFSHLNATFDYHALAEIIQLTEIIGELNDLKTAYFNGANGPLEATIGTDITFEGADNRFSAKTIKLQIINSMRLTGTDTVLGPSTVSLSCSGRHPIYTISNLTLKTTGAAVGTGEEPFRIENIHLGAEEGTFDSSRPSLEVLKMSLDTSLIKNLNGSLNGPIDHVTFRIRGDNTGVLEAGKSLGLLPAGFQFEARRDQLDITGELTGQRLAFECTMDCQEVGFQNQAGTYLGEKINTTIRSKGEWDFSQSRLKTDGRFDLKSGEILLDRFYFNLAENPFSARLAGADYRLSDEALSFTGFDIDFKDILKISTAGRLRIKSGIKDLHVRINLPETPVNSLYEHFGLEPFKIEKPFLEKLALSGHISTNLTVEGDFEHPLVHGRCTVKNGSISLSDNDFSVQGIEWELPLWYAPLPHKDMETNSLHGRLAISSISHTMLPEQSLDIPIEVKPNRLQFEGPISLKIPGGVVQMDAINIQDILTPDMRVQSGIHLDELRLEPLFSPLWAQPIEGTAQGDISPIMLQNGRIWTKGKFILNLFGGMVVINNVEVDKLFSLFPVLKLDGMWHDLNLADMTTGTAFGKIEGILNGQVKNLEIANGQPQNFQLLVETEKKKGIRQRISIKAVENIAHLGGGGSPFMGLAGTFASLFRTFPYEKIGARASLENDIFRVNGLIREGEQEYLVKRSGFSGVDVVNQNQDNRIRFKDMVKRIKRITASDRGPVIE